MKKFFFIAAIASAALVSCTKNEVITVADQHEITFSAPVVGPQTKAQYGEIGVNYNASEHFGVYAVHTPEELTTWAAGSLYMGTPNATGAAEGLEVLKAAGENYWAPTAPYYWPKEGYLSFAAYSPIDVTGTVTYGATGLSVLGHTVSANTAEHVDFMYAPRVYNRQSSTEETNDVNGAAGNKHNYEGVNILFNHAMSSIVFKVARAKDIDATTVISLNRLTITKPCMTADFAETITDGATYKASPVWSNFTNNTENLVTYNVPVALTTTLKEYVNKTGEVDNDVILIPQDITNDMDVIIDYTIFTPGGHSVEQKTKIDLNATGRPTKWEIGKRYTYNITIGLDEVIFDPAVTDWSDVDPETDIVL